MLTVNEIKRYSKQIKLRQVGETGQHKLKEAKVLVIGAGGLGCPLLQYLAASGIGNIGVIDYDVVSESNLHRQILFNASDIGRKKVEVVKEKLQLLNPFIIITTYSEALIKSNAFKIISSFDYVVDACDSIALRYLISDACEIQNKPYLYAAISDFEGQFGVFSVNEFGEYISYRDYFPFNNEILNTATCADNGVIPTLPGIIAMYQSNELIKLILNLGNSLKGKIKHIDVLTNSEKVFTISKSNDLRPADEVEFKKWNYPVELCSTVEVINLTSSEFEQRKSSIEKLIDVRELDEVPEIHCSNLIKISSKNVEEIINRCLELKEVMFICQSGKRSLNVARIIKEKYPNKKVYNLLKGVNELID